MSTDKNAENIPAGVLYDPEHRDFYSLSMESMGAEFRRAWIDLAHLFPQIVSEEDMP